MEDMNWAKCAASWDRKTSNYLSRSQCFHKELKFSVDFGVVASLDHFFEYFAGIVILVNGPKFSYGLKWAI